MITVKNNSKVTLGLPGGVYLQPGQSVETEEAAVYGSRVIMAWAEKGILLVGEPVYIEAQAINEKEPRQIPANAVAEAEQDDKDRLIAALAEIGIERDRRYSVETLQALLGESNE